VSGKDDRPTYALYYIIVVGEKRSHIAPVLVLEGSVAGHLICNAVTPYAIIIIVSSRGNTLISQIVPTIVEIPAQQFFA